jgi:hypothetical protein
MMSSWLHCVVAGPLLLLASVSCRPSVIGLTATKPLGLHAVFVPRDPLVRALEEAAGPVTTRAVLALLRGDGGQRQVVASCRQSGLERMEEGLGECTALAQDRARGADSRKERCAAGRAFLACSASSLGHCLAPGPAAFLLGRQRRHLRRQGRLAGCRGLGESPALAYRDFLAAALAGL